VKIRSLPGWADSFLAITWAIEGEGSRPRCPSFRLGLLAASAFVIDDADTYVDSWEVVDFIDTVRKANQDNFVIIFQDIVELKTQLQGRLEEPAQEPQKEPVRRSQIRCPTSGPLYHQELLLQD
jgi:hypothetical protein